MRTGTLQCIRSGTPKTRPTTTEPFMTPLSSVLRPGRADAVLLGAHPRTRLKAALSAKGLP